MSIQAVDTIRKTEKFFSTKIGEDLVIYDDENGAYLGLGETGTHIFDLIEGPTRVADLIDQLGTIFDIDRTTLETDVLAFLDQLDTHKLIERISA